MDNKENNINPNLEPNPNSEPEIEIEVNVEQVEVSGTPDPSIVDAPTTNSMEVPVETEVQPLFAKQPKAASQTEGGAKSKKKIGMIIAICVAAVLLIGGGVFAAVYFSWKNSDAVVVLDAVTGAMKKSKVAVTGTMNIEFNEDNQESSGLKSMKLALGTAQNNADMRGDGTLTLTTTDDKNVDIVIGGAFVSDGTIYVRIDGINEALMALDLPEDAALIMDYLEALIEDIDGQWYKIQIADLNLGTEAEETYQCMVNAINGAVKEDSRNELVDLYKEYPFVVAKKQDKKDSEGNAIYNVSWNPEDLAGYLNGMTDTKAYNSIADCAGSDASDPDTVTPEDVKVPDDMPTLNLHIGGSHELRGFSAKYEEDGNSLNAEFYFGYDDDVKLEIPSDAKSVDDLMSTIEDSINGVVEELMKEQVEAQCAVYTGTLYDECIDYYTDAMEEYLKDLDWSDIWSIAGAATV